MSVWLWLMLAALLVLPVLLRSIEDDPRNGTGDDLTDRSDEDDPDALVAAA
jgi:hypothetical protein